MLASSMPRKRAHILLLEELLAELDGLVGVRSRSAFLTELVQREIKRRKLLLAVREARLGKLKTIPSWTTARRLFVEHLRTESDARLEDLAE